MSDFVWLVFDFLGILLQPSINLRWLAINSWSMPVKIVEVTEMD